MSAQRESTAAQSVELAALQRFQGTRTVLEVDAIYDDAADELRWLGAAMSCIIETARHRRIREIQTEEACRANAARSAEGPGRGRSDRRDGSLADVVVPFAARRSQSADRAAGSRRDRAAPRTPLLHRDFARRPADLRARITSAVRRHGRAALTAALLGTLIGLIAFTLYDSLLQTRSVVAQHMGRFP